MEFLHHLSSCPALPLGIRAPSQPRLSAVSTLWARRAGAGQTLTKSPCEWPGLSNGVGRRDCVEVNFLRLRSNFAFWGGIPQGLNNPRVSSQFASSLLFRALAVSFSSHPPDVWHPSPPVLRALAEGNSPGRWHPGLLRATTHRGVQAARF